jgi:UDP-N-acetylglucosamine enolpyruvyl transferase
MRPSRLLAARPAPPAQGRDSRAARPALRARGAPAKSTLGPLETVERGYTDVVDRLKSLGAAVEVAPS